MTEQVTSDLSLDQLKAENTSIKTSITAALSKIQEGVNLLSTPQPQPAVGGLFGGSGGDFIPEATTTKLYTGPVMGGRGRTRRHKNKRHSYSRKNKKGLKNRIKNMFGFRGGSEMPASPGFSLPGLKKGGTTNVKSPL